MGEKIPVSESERRLLEEMARKLPGPGSYSVDELTELLGVERSRLEALARLLAEKGLLGVEERSETLYRLTEEAERYLREGFPEERLVALLSQRGGCVPLDAVRQELGREAAIALSNAAKKKWVKVEKGCVRLLVDPQKAVAEERGFLQSLSRGGSLPREAVSLLRRRRLVEKSQRKETVIRIAEDPRSLLEKTVVEIGALTHEILRSGRWRGARLRRYNVAAEPPRRRLGRLHFFAEFIEHIRDVMKEMGFREVEAPPVESEFWNYDVLFQPQFHPARGPSDTFYLSNPSRGVVPEEVAGRVRVLHEKGAALPGGESLGWRYRWSSEKAARLILRSHTTAVSARVLSGRPTPPFRFFTIGRVYRVEKIDAKHLPEFHQVDGIASEDGVSMKWLLGILAEFLERLGLREYRFRPAYFPFTEPSVEGYVRIGSDWLEVLGAGLFRPEVLHAVGVEYPVAAWGMGIERLAMALYNVDDIRRLYARDLGYVENMPVRWWLYAGSTL